MTKCYLDPVIVDSALAESLLSGQPDDEPLGSPTRLSACTIAVQEMASLQKVSLIDINKSEQTRVAEDASGGGRIVLADNGIGAPLISGTQIARNGIRCK